MDGGPLAPGHRLPALHEAQERQEIANLLEAGLAERFGVEVRRFGTGLWAVRSLARPDHPPGNQVMALSRDGLDRDDLEALEEVGAWFDAGACTLHLRWPGHALEDDAEALEAAGLRIREIQAWMAAPLTDLDVKAHDHDIVEIANADQADAWVQAFCRGWGLSSPEDHLLIRGVLGGWPGPPSWRRFLARVGGEPAGEALLVQFEGGIAYLAEASTVPAFRRRGIQRALIARRIHEARDAGCHTLFGAVCYGDASWRNMRALGLRQVNLTAGFVRRRL